MVNKVVLIGNLGRDPELFHTQGGRALARLWVATHEVWTKGGQHQRRTEWHRVLVWGARAEHIAARLRKGALVYVDGQIRSGKPTDGDPRTEIHAQRLIPLGGRAQDEAADPDAEAVVEELTDGDKVPF
jgi:single-strand DNA-binding protein